MVNKADNLSLYQAKKDEYDESGKYVNFLDGDGNKCITSLNYKAIKKDISLAGYNLLVTFEISVDDIDIYDAYHNL